MSVYTIAPMTPIFLFRIPMRGYELAWAVPTRAWERSSESP